MLQRKQQWSDRYKWRESKTSHNGPPAEQSQNVKTIFSRKQINSIERGKDKQIKSSDGRMEGAICPLKLKRLTARLASYLSLCLRDQIVWFGCERNERNERNKRNERNEPCGLMHITA